MGSKLLALLRKCYTLLENKHSNDITVTIPITSHPTYLVDGSGYIFRAFYAVAPLTTRNGFHTNALFGFTKMMLKLLKDTEGKNLAVVFDTGRETFRKELYPEYKANRAAPPPELVEQFPYFKEIVDALGIPTIDLPRYEADDVIATIAERLTKDGKEVIVVSGDKDLMQLVSEKIFILDTMKQKEIRTPQVIEKFGVAPEKVTEVLALMGDDSDNIPGVKGIGPKTAAQLIVKCGSVEELLKNPEVILSDASIRGKQKVYDAIIAHREDLIISRKLVEVDRNAPVVLGPDKKRLEDLSEEDIANFFTSQGPQEKLSDLIEKFEFESLLKDFTNSKVKKVDTSRPQFSLVLKDSFDEFKKRLCNVKQLSFDLETTSLDTKIAHIVGASFCCGESEVFYVPLRHVCDGQVSEKDLLDLMRAINKPDVLKIAHNLKYDYGVLKQHNIELVPPFADTMLSGYLLNPDERSFSLERLSETYLQKSSISYDSLVPKGGSFADVPVSEALQYAGEDAWYCFLLHQNLSTKIADLGLSDVLENIEIPLIPVISDMEREGVLLDTDMLSKISDEFSVELESLTQKIFESAGGEFNMNSPKQLAEVLFERLGISTKGLKKTKTGISTDSSVLEQLSSLHTLPGLILRYRGLFKLKSTYLDALPLSVSEKTKRVHTSFHQTGTSTGRLSSSDPNLQNIPIQTSEGRRIREAFVSDKGNLLLSADYSQIELRILAHLSGDETFIAAFKEGVDIHAQTAREILNIPPLLEVPSEARRLGKTMNFGIIYGMGAFRLAKELQIPFAEAQKYIDFYFARYSKVKKFFDELDKSVASHGFVTTITGRKRFIGSLEEDIKDKGFLHRIAINAPIQGSAADIVKLAMLATTRSLRELEVRARLLLQIHDELVFEVAEKDVEIVKKMVKSQMEGVMSLKVPLLVEMGVGRSWNEAHA